MCRLPVVQGSNPDSFCSSLQGRLPLLGGASPDICDRNAGSLMDWPVDAGRAGLASQRRR